MNVPKEAWLFLAGAAMTAASLLALWWEARTIHPRSLTPPPAGDDPGVDDPARRTEAR
jgi:hypothetical protein